MQSKARRYSWRCLPTLNPPLLPAGGPGGLAVHPTVPTALPPPVPTQWGWASHRGVRAATGPTEKGHHHATIQPRSAWGSWQQCFSSWLLMELQFIPSLLERSRETPGAPSKGTTPTAENPGTAGVTAVLSEIPGQPFLWVKRQSHECNPFFQSNLTSSIF